MNQLRLLHLIRSADPAEGGPIEGILRQDQALGGSSGRVLREMVVLDPPDRDFLGRVPFPVHALGRSKRKTANPAKRFLDHYRFSPAYIPWLQSNAHRFDAIVVHGLWNFSAFAASRALRKLQVPYFVFTHGMMDPWFKQKYPAKHWAKQISWIFIEGPLLAGARSVLFTTQEEATLARQIYAGHRYRERVVGYGTTQPPAPTAQQATAFALLTPRLGRRPYLLFLSRIHPKKGCDVLLDAFATIAGKYPALDLVIAGPDRDGWASELRRRADALRIGNRVHWTGLLDGDAKWGAYYGAQAFVLPSHSENFGIVVAEALGCGVPVLISDKVNIWREVAISGAGLVSPDDPASFARILEEFLAGDSNYRGTLSMNALECFTSHFDLRTTASTIIDAISSEAAPSSKAELSP